MCAPPLWTSASWLINTASERNTEFQIRISILVFYVKLFTKAKPIKTGRNWTYTRMNYFCQYFLLVNSTIKRNRQKYLQSLLRSSNQGSPGNCFLTQMIAKIFKLIRELSKQLDLFLQVNSEGPLCFCSDTGLDSRLWDVVFC